MCEKRESSSRLINHIFGESIHSVLPFLLGHSGLMLNYDAIHAATAAVVVVDSCCFILLPRPNVRNSSPLLLCWATAAAATGLCGQQGRQATKQAD